MPAHCKPIRRLSLTYTGREEIKMARNGRTELPARDEYGFAIVMQHKVSVTLGDREKQSAGRALSGEIFLIPAHSRCMMDSMENQAASIVLIYFRCEPPGLPLTPDFHPFRMPLALSWVQHLVDDGRECPDTAAFYRLQSHLYALAFSYMEILHKPKETVLAVFVEQAKQLMLDAYKQPMDMEELAKSSGASPNRFYKVFREHTGLSPHKYMTKIRLDASLRLLANTHSPIVEVAHGVGYPDEYYFSRLFKKQMGLTPSEYAACAKKKVAVMTGVFKGDLSVLGLSPYIGFQRGWQEHPEPVLDQLADAEPELILSGPLPEQLHDRLLAIAPVAVLRWKEYSWKERLLDISGLFGLTPVAERWLADYDSKVANARHHVKHVLGEEPFLVVHAVEGSYYIFGMKLRKLRDIFYDDLQVTPPATARQISIVKVDSLDEIAKLDCEHVLFLVQSSISEAYCTELEQQWRALKPSRHKKRCLFIRRYDSPLYNALVNESLVEQMVRQLLNIPY